MKTAIFGGTFDPFHNGHVAVLKTLEKAPDINDVFIVPNPRPPYKKKPLTPIEDRLSMIKLGLVDYKFKIPIQIMENEIYRDTSFTIDTVNEFLIAFPKKTFTIVIGSDQFFSFHKWKNYDEILKKVSLTVINREGYEENDFDVYKNKFLSSVPDTHIHQIQMTPIPVSSTMVRSRQSKKGSLMGLVPRSVEDYITHNQLYS